MTYVTHVFRINLDFQATGNEGVPDGISADPRGRHNTNGDEDDGNLSCGSTSSFEDQDRKGGSSKIRTLRSNVSLFILINQIVSNVIYYSNTQ